MRIRDRGWGKECHSASEHGLLPMQHCRVEWETGIRAGVNWREKGRHGKDVWPLLLLQVGPKMYKSQA